MNWLDIILIIVIIIVFIGGLVFSILCWVEHETSLGFGSLFASLVIAGLLILPFVVLDKGSGSTIGIITSVDKNFFGTTAIYVKTSETTQETYCVEFNEKLIEKAKEMIGKEVKISYGERVGLYSTGKCSQAPVEKIEIFEIEKVEDK